MEAGVQTLGAAAAERAQRKKEKIAKLRENKALLKEKLDKHKLIAQRCGKEEERKRKEREHTNITAYFGRGRMQTSSSEGSDLPWDAGHFAPPGSFPGTAIEVLSSNSGGKSSFGSSVGHPAPEVLSVMEDDPLAAEIPSDELQLLSDSEEDGAICSTPPIRKRRRNYDRTRKFQLEWEAKLPWAEDVLTEDGRLHMVKCRPCTAMEGVPKLLAPKFDTLLKHEGRRRAIRDQPLKNIKKEDVYMAKEYKHQRNNAIYSAR
jgi:hypothetical protein